MNIPSGLGLIIGSMMPYGIYDQYFNVDDNACHL